MHYQKVELIEGENRMVVTRAWGCEVGGMGLKSFNNGYEF
jgi:hypothetical protein